MIILAWIGIVVIGFLVVRRAGRRAKIRVEVLNPGPLYCPHCGHPWSAAAKTVASKAS